MLLNTKSASELAAYTSSNLTSRESWHRFHSHWESIFFHVFLSKSFQVQLS